MTQIKKYSKLLLIFLMFIVISTVCGCGCENEKSNDIYIVFTGDVHCADDENIGYDGLASYVNYLKTKSDNIVLVDTGDFIQGDYVGAVTKGDYIIDMMNRLNYDYAVLGNHEFDYGMGILSELMDKSNSEFLGCNITYTGSGENPLKDLKPYAIKEIGDFKVGFVGVSTPASVVSSTPTNFMENGQFAFDFASGDDGNTLFAKV